MSKKQLRDELMYQATMRVARRMREEGLMTAVEYAEIEKIFLAKYRPIIGNLAVVSACKRFRDIYGVKGARRNAENKQD